jgi:hypothetical protein
MHAPRATSGVVIIGILGILIGLTTGCASRGTVKPITGPADLASLAGRWEGFGTGPGGASTRTTFGIAPEGRYTAQIGAFTSTGMLRIADGQLVTVPEGAARGAFATDHGATIEVRERDGGLVLFGDGRSDRGPYSFEVTRRP